MAGSPLTVDHFIVQASVAANKEGYRRGPGDYYMFGWCRFKWGAYDGKIQFLNSEKNIIFPEHAGFDGFQYQAKPGVLLFIKAVYGSLDAFSPEIQSRLLSMVGGKFGGLKAIASDGTLGNIPTFNPRELPPPP